MRLASLPYRLFCAGLLTSLVALFSCENAELTNAPANLKDGGKFLGKFQVESPVATPAPGIFNEPQTVTLTSTTQDSKIFYTTDGSLPTVDSAVYSEPIVIESSQKISAFAVKAGFRNSEFVSFDYTINPTVMAPDFSIAGSSYGPPQTITLSSETTGATIYYTINGETPTRSSLQYAEPIIVSSSTTIKAFAVMEGLADSNVSTASYIINGAVTAPMGSSASGTYNSAQAVILSSATSEAVIYYTLDGSAPTKSSNVYTTPLFVGVSQTIKAMAVKANHIDSEVSTFEYTITGTVAAPEFSVASGSYGPAQTVSLSSITPGATIYYTTDGQAPTSSSQQYSVPISVASSQTIRAVAVKTNWTDSSESTATYTINGAVASPTADPVQCRR
jgi:hypothetical protein